MQSTKRALVELISNLELNLPLKEENATGGPATERAFSDLDDSSIEGGSSLGRASSAPGFRSTTALGVFGPGELHSLAKDVYHFF
jgi:hypothetical protein